MNEDDFAVALDILNDDSSSRELVAWAWNVFDRWRAMYTPVVAHFGLGSRSSSGRGPHMGSYAQSAKGAYLNSCSTSAEFVCGASSSSAGKDAMLYSHHVRPYR